MKFWKEVLVAALVFALVFGGIVWLEYATRPPQVGALRFEQAPPTAPADDAALVS